jgi:hypothetical protein
MLGSEGALERRGARHGPGCTGRTSTAPWAAPGHRAASSSASSRSAQSIRK